MHETYRFVNADTGETVYKSAYELMNAGLRLKIAEPRQSLLLKYDWIRK